MQNILVCLLMLVGLIFSLTPIIYIFLRLANKIGPQDDGDAIGLGIVLLLICAFMSIGIFYYLTLALHLPPIPGMN